MYVVNNSTFGLHRSRLPFISILMKLCTYNESVKPKLKKEEKNIFLFKFLNGISDEDRIFSPITTEIIAMRGAFGSEIWNGAIDVNVNHKSRIRIYFNNCDMRDLYLVYD